MDLQHKYTNLINYLIGLNKVAIAFSGGVDSTFLLSVSAKALRRDDILAITVTSSFMPQSEVDEAKIFCEENSIRQMFLPINVLSEPNIASNPQKRCYFCKKMIFSKIKELADSQGIKNVLDGTNFDDLSDYRPGMLALEELTIKSPLKNFEFTKKEIRFLSKELNLKTYNKPTFACLATRFMYNDFLTEQKLSLVENAESFLKSLGFYQYRVRYHQNMARIELDPLQMPLIIRADIKNAVVSKFKELGFTYVSLDLSGYRAGNMNNYMAKI